MARIQVKLPAALLIIVVTFLIIATMVLYSNPVGKPAKITGVHPLSKYNDRRHREALNPHRQPVYNFMKNCSVENCTFEEVQRERKLHVWRVCNTTKYKQTNNSYFARHRFDHMYYLNRTGTVFCTVPKAASTTLKKLMLASNTLDYNLLSIHNTHDVFDRHVIQLSKLPETEIMNLLHNSTKIIIVRHPFTRLLSAFKDKLEPSWADDFFPRPDFIDQIQNKLGLEKSESVSFSEFSRYLTNPDNDFIPEAQEHWREIHKICMPCEVKYDVIIKFEHLYDGELEPIYRLLKISNMYVPPEHYTGASDKMVMKQYFSTLSKETMKLLYQRYWIDFALFSYRIEAEYAFKTAVVL